MSERLPDVYTEIRELSQMQSRWSSIIQPVLDLPQNNSVLLQNVVLSTSSVINHTLGRPLIGWNIVRQRGSAVVYDRQDINQVPDRTLLLSASSGVSVDLIVF